ncbi:MAG TPA: hypothetical protein VFZ66_25545 [Herpetosiphonaceae bacterium]
MLSNIARSRRVLLLIAVAILGLIGGRLAATPEDSEAESGASAAHHNSNAFLMPTPNTLGELVEKADIIVVGTIGEELRQQSFVGYDEQGRAITASDQRLPAEAETLFHDFAVNVEEVIKDDGTIQAQQPLVLRTIFARNTKEIDPAQHYPGVFPGDRYLLLLSRNPDHATYGFYYAAASRLLIDGDAVTLSDGARTPLPFSKGVAPQAFLGQLRRMVRQQQ